MGAMLGDYVEVGCNSVLNPGTVIGRHCNILSYFLCERAYRRKQHLEERWKGSKETWVSTLELMASEVKLIKV